jgi:outer membrane protein assembly factor BamB
VRSITLRRFAALATSVAVLAVPTLASAQTSPNDPAQVWVRPLPGATVRQSSPLLLDVDGDGKLDLTFGAYDKRIYSLAGTTGQFLWGWPQPTTHRINSTPAAADVTGDGRPELFVGSGIAGARDGAYYSFDTVVRTRFRQVLAVNDFRGGAPVHSSPAMGDVNGDRVVDANVGALAVNSLWSMRATDGIPNYRRSLLYWDDTIFASPALADVTGDGVAEVISGGDSTPGLPVDWRGGMVRAVTGTGRVVWTFHTNDIVVSSPSVGDIDGDGRQDVVFGVGDYYHGSDATSVFALDAQTGRLKWRRATDGVTAGSPALADIDGDGNLDVAIGTFNSNPQRAGDIPLPVQGGSVYALDGRTGRDLPGFPQASRGGMVLGSVVTADIDGDGAQDPIVPTGAMISAFSGRSGALLFKVAEGASVAFQNSPAVGDVDGDGRLDMVAVGTRTDGTGMAYRWALPPSAKLGPLGWAQFRKDPRHTGAWSLAGLAVARASSR